MINKRLQARIQRAWLGTEFFISRWRLRCLDCGNLIKWRALLHRTWRYSACPACEGFHKYMIEGRHGHAINPYHPANLRKCDELDR